MPNKFMRSVMHRLSRLALLALTRTTVTGLENIPANGPLLILANHNSTIDPMLLLAFLPSTTEFVGPGDFKLLFPANVIIEWYGLVPVKRSVQLERSSLKLMTDILKSGRMLGLFPQGGTWEKPITDAKAGAAYLSASTGSPILPVGLGGTYQVWNKIARLQRPHMTVNIGKVMLPVQLSGNKPKRSEELETATQEIMRRIYDLCPPEDRQWYDDLARCRYDLIVEVWKKPRPERVSLPGSTVLGELVVKPNLMSPLINNAKLALDPLQKSGVRFPVSAVREAASALQTALHGPFAGYMEYRLGDEKSRDLYMALDALIALAETAGVNEIALTPTSSAAADPAGDQAL
jgi:1-acyl-sn-glycerol-3-phosphate acyltransferase